MGRPSSACPSRLEGKAVSWSDTETEIRRDLHKRNLSDEALGMEQKQGLSVPGTAHRAENECRKRVEKDGT